jgi:hypothetical protein
MANTTIDTAAAARADRDQTAIVDKLGIVTRSPLSGGDGTGTAFPHGTALCDYGVMLADRDRADFLSLPTVEAGMDALRAVVQAEQRADHWIDLGGVSLDDAGRIVTEPDLETGVAVNRLASSEDGLARLAAFAPGGSANRLATNVNAWASGRRGHRVRFRTRLTADERDRELYAVLGPDYVPYDLDSIATDVAELLPSDARVRLSYDRQRACIDAVLQNPHHFPDSTGVASVGEAHRLALRITTADDGSEEFALRWSAERIRCVNLTLLTGSNTVFRARHTRCDLAASIRAALAAQGAVMTEFAAVWRAAWRSYYYDTVRAGDRLSAEEALRRIVFHGLLWIPRLRQEEVWSAVKAAWDAEPGDSVAHVHNAITRAAHKTPALRGWADTVVEEQAAMLLYRRVHALATIPDEDRERLGWPTVARRRVQPWPTVGAPSWVPTEQRVSASAHAA